MTENVDCLPNVNNKILIKFPCVTRALIVIYLSILYFFFDCSHFSCSKGNLFLLPQHYDKKLEKLFFLMIFLLQFFVTINISMCLSFYLTRGGWLFVYFDNSLLDLQKQQQQPKLLTKTNFYLTSLKQYLLLKQILKCLFTVGEGKLMFDLK